MNVYDYLDELEEIVDAAWTIPFNGKAFVEADAIREAIDSIRTQLPTEISQAKGIVRDRNKIINDAKEKAESIIHQAKNKANVLVSNEEVSKLAKKRATITIKNSEDQAKQIKKAANDYIDKILQITETKLTENLKDFREIRRNVHSAEK